MFVDAYDLDDAIDMAAEDYVDIASEVQIHEQTDDHFLLVGTLWRCFGDIYWKTFPDCIVYKLTQEQPDEQEAC